MSSWMIEMESAKSFPRPPERGFGLAQGIRQAGAKITPRRDHENVTDAVAQARTPNARRPRLSFRRC
jgi:hypothetical protein